MPTNRFTVLFVVVALLAALATGCGKKGPLYLPDQTRPGNTASPNP
ncbi:MAG: lipoprotein [Chromatiales bacterium]|nr:lipoprotein [Chromatiales bacterium]